MAEHYTADTESVTRWCNRCSKPTRHVVSANRVGRCMEHEAPELSKAQQRRRAKVKAEKQNPRLF